MVQTITMPAGVAELAALDPVDYHEAFAFETDSVRRPENWARLILENAPLVKRAVMLSAWTGLGVRLAALGSDGQVLGWRIRHSGPEAVVLGMQAAIGITARIVIQVDHQRVVHAMLIRYDRSIARPVWRMVAPRHRRFIGALLDRANVAAAPAVRRV